MIEAEGLIYDYPDGRALDGASFTAPRGRITALVGPNGAGKTTVMRVLAGLLRPHGGVARVDGLDIGADPRAAHRRVGYLPDFIGLYDRLSGLRHLLHAGAAAGLSLAESRRRGVEIAESLQIADLLGRRAEAMSRGQRQRLALAAALMKRPPLLILDEPASGLDPEARRGLSMLLRRLKAEGATLLVSSHILSELDDYSDRVVVMRGGRVIRVETLARTAGAAETVTIEFSRPVSGLAGALRAAAADVVVLATSDLTAEIRCPPGAEARAGMLAALIRAGLPVASFAPRKRRLEDAYFEPARSEAPGGEQ